MANTNFHKAKRAKNDEFYTQLVDIEKELRHYKDHFVDKVVFCNCDDPFKSNFFKYFAMNFNHLGLKKLITTSYVEEGQAKKIELTVVGDENDDGAVDLADVEILLQENATRLEGNGDFRSEECVKLLKEADIIVTNPPFSLFREYVAQLAEQDKKFLIIGNMNAITYKEIFALLRSNKMWLGYTNPKEFYKPDGSTQKFGNIKWYTNLEHDKRNENLALYKKYTEKEYQKYDNYDAININKVADIPYDYSDVMGVPITFIGKYNPKQFEVIGLGISSSGLEIGVRPYKEEHKKYRKEIQKRGAVDGDLYMLTEGIVTVPYARILIKRKGGL